MKLSRLIFVTASAATFLVGCGHDNADDRHREQGGTHEHGAASSPGASFKPGTGILLTQETREILGVQIADVTERKLPLELRFSVQFFGEKHRRHVKELDHSGCDVLGAGSVPAVTAAGIKVGQPVQLFKGTNASQVGVVVAFQKPAALGESEIIVGLSNAADLLKSGEFLSAVINLPRENPVTVVPVSSVHRTAEGFFVYKANGEALLRIEVTLGTETSDFMEITAGLLAGDQVVTKPVETLWLIELNATKGGGHSH